MGREATHQLFLNVVFGRTINLCDYLTGSVEFSNFFFSCLGVCESLSQCLAMKAGKFWSSGGVLLSP